MSEKLDLLFEGPDEMVVMNFTNPETKEQAMYPFSKGQVTQGVVRWVVDQCLAMNPSGYTIEDYGAACHYGAKFFSVVNGGEG